MPMPVDKADIVQFLRSQADRPLKSKEIARALGVEARDYPRFKALLRDMEDAGTLYRVRKGRYALPKRINLVVGQLQSTRAGHAFVLPEGSGPDVFINASRLGNAVDGDRVVARVERQRRGSNPEGTVVKVLERARTQVVGVFRRSGRYSSIAPEDRKLHRDVFVPAGADAGAKEGEVVVARILEWGSNQRNPIGEVVEVLGASDEPGVDVLAIVRDRELPDEFPPEVAREAAAAAERGGTIDLTDRHDLRDLLTFTIDPVDAKDHDDALSVEELGDDRVRVGIHIADVSHYVREGSALDLEALRRGTSIYLVDRVLPMLPEALSADACSLKPDEDRLTLSALLELDGAAQLTSVSYVAGVIRSRYKLSYDEAQEMIDGRRKAERDLRRALRRLRDLARRLRQKRQGRGGLDFDLPEARVVLNAAGEPTEVQQLLRLDSHRLVEEFMLLANEAVARLARRRKWPFIYRVHEPPDPDRIERLREFLAGLSLPLRKNAHRSPKGLQAVLQAVDGRPEEALVAMLVLRSLKQACYSIERKGHFGLAATAYTHFTSPIRRYPDLVVHRLLRSAVLEGNKVSESLTDRLSAVAEHASARERRAMKAERDSVELKKIEFIERHIGDVFHGTISGVASYGVFVLLDGVLAEGLLHVSLLDDDYYHFVEEEYSLIGEHHRRRLRLGDRLVVRVIAVDRRAREVNLAAVE